MAETMNALMSGYGPVLELHEAPRPAPQGREVLIRTRAMALNNADGVETAENDPTGGGSGEKKIAGYEAAGEIVDVGPGVNFFQVGDVVAANATEGFAEYVTADERHTIAFSDDVEITTQAASTTALLTEYGSITVGRFKEGQSVLVTGATSAIGTVGVQILRELGAGRIIATSRTQERADLLLAYGADHAIVSDETMTDKIMELTAGQGVDLVIDHVGGRTLTDAMACSADYGNLVSVGRLGGTLATIDQNYLNFRHLTIHGTSYGFSDPDQLGDVNAALPETVKANIHPIVDSVYTVADVDKALDRLRDSGLFGKVTLTWE